MLMKVLIVIKRIDCDGVIAFGGGSGLDVGKAVAFMSGTNFTNLGL